MRRDWYRKKDKVGKKLKERKKIEIYLEGEKGACGGTYGKRRKKGAMSDINPWRRTWLQPHLGNTQIFKTCLFFTTKLWGRGGV